MPLMAGLTGLTDLDVLVLDIADLTDRSLAVKTDEADFTGGKSDLSHAVLLSHQLCSSAGGADELRALARVKLNVVDEGTDGDIRDRKRVAGLDIGISAGVNDIAVLQTLRSDECSFFSPFSYCNESDVRGSVRIVLDADDGSGLSSLHCA